MSVVLICCVAFVTVPSQFYLALCLINDLVHMLIHQNQKLLDDQTFGQNFV